ncbi:AfsR/SARP family transcriptional regulator [Actinoplanes sp. NPDC023801]|uniref:AfsR/SARP family transcriptional regulator n=1 Tax=Actinoplanes sp. NPDC023801 TaxID=3154595 RepID=UPI0033F32C42
MAQDEPVFAALGPLTVLDPGGASDPLPPGKRRSLLAVLLRHRNTWVPVEELAGALWDRTGYPSSISGSLKTYVHQLRKLLPDDSGGERLAGGRGAYRLAVRPGELDLDLFESLVNEGVEALAGGRPADAVARQRRALGLWRGLPDEDIVDVVTARHLEEMRWTARYCQADALIEQGDAAEAIVVLRAALGDDPLRELVWERLMLAQRAAGWQVDALASYEQARATLLEKFGAEPGRRLQEIYRTLLSDTAAAPAKPAVTPTAPVVVPVASAVAHSASVVAPSAPAGGSDVVRPEPAAVASPARRWSRALFAGLLVALLASLSGSSVPRPARDVPALTTASRPRVLFGLGPNVIEAERSPLVPSGIGMMTTWYHGPKQLNQMEGWRNDVIPRIYRSGRAMHVVVATWEEGTSIETSRGRACGQPYPLSAEFLPDMRRLARAFAGRPDGPPLYISMFHGLQKLACANTGYLADPATTLYYQALKDRYFEVLKLFHEEAPNARVALNWDGWTASYDEPGIGAGMSMFQYFVEAMSASDFQSFNAFEKKGNAEDIRQMVEVLGAYGPVMCAYFGPHEDPVDVYETDLRATFTPAALSGLVADGLFAFSFRDDDLLRASPSTMTMATQVVRDYGHLPPRG